jgi:hypothetical protein
MLQRIALWKYGMAVVIILGGCVYVSRQDQKTRDQYEQKCNQLNARVISPSGHYEDCDKGAENAAQHLPRWYRFFVWPEGTTTWAILLTLLVIADQTTQTRKAAEAALASANSAKTQIEVMRTQARHMESQTRILGDSVAETRRSVNVAVEQIEMAKNKERARLEIEIEKFEYTPSTKQLFIQKIRWCIRLHGQSEAFIITSTMIGCIGEPNRETLQNHGRQMDIRYVMGPSDRIAQGECFISPLSASGEDVGYFDLTSLKERKGVLWCMGAIVFKDVFGDAWLIRFRRRWAYELFGSDEIDGDGWGGEWVREGEGENEEQPVRISTANVPTKPN